MAASGSISFRRRGRRTACRIEDPGVQASCIGSARLRGGARGWRRTVSGDRCPAPPPARCRASRRPGEAGPQRGQRGEDVHDRQRRQIAVGPRPASVTLSAPASPKAASSERPAGGEQAAAPRIRGPWRPNVAVIATGCPGTRCSTVRTHACAVRCLGDRRQIGGVRLRVHRSAHRVRAASGAGASDARQTLAVPPAIWTDAWPACRARQARTASRVAGWVVSWPIVKASTRATSRPSRSMPASACAAAPVSAGRCSASSRAEARDPVPRASPDGLPARSRSTRRCAAVRAGPRPPRGCRSRQAAVRRRSAAPPARSTTCRVGEAGGVAARGPAAA